VCNDKIYLFEVTKDTLKSKEVIIFIKNKFEVTKDTLKSKEVIIFLKKNSKFKGR
jgi:small nuclear ribonucleoprotein (snRNP)-like protein